MLLKGKCAVVTGCSRGIGKAIMTVFAENGADIYACARKYSSEYEEMLKDISDKNKVSIIPLYFDMVNEDEMKSAVNKIKENKSPVDILVNNAGVSHGGILQMTKIEEIKHIFDVNYFCHISLIQKIERIMARQKKGSIINIASVMAIDGEKGTLAYGGSKAALIQATKVLSKEMSINNIRVNAIAPGYTETDMFFKNDKQVVEAILSKTSLKRIAQPEEIARIAVFLASDLSSYITGQVIRADGGH